MDEKQKIEELKKILSDKNFTTSLLDMESPEEVQKAIKAKGVDVSIEEINAVKAELAKTDSEELSDDQLENVAGGLAITTAITIATVIGAVVGGTVALGNATDRWTRRRW